MTLWVWLFAFVSGVNDKSKNDTLSLLVAYPGAR